VVIKTESHEHCRTTSLLVVVKAGSGFSQRGAALPAKKKKGEQPDEQKHPDFIQESLTESP
jgi:hypothetical protein